VCDHRRILKNVANNENACNDDGGLRVDAWGCEGASDQLFGDTHVPAQSKRDAAPSEAPTPAIAGGPMSAPALTESELRRIHTSAGWRRDRVEVFETSLGRVIAKGHRPTRSPAPQRVLAWLARLVRVPFLRAPIVHGGARSQEIEIRRLRALRAAGIPVPKVLHVATDFFVMTWLGGDHLAEVLHRRHPHAFALWRDAAEALVGVHAAGQYLSQCFGRNIIVHAEPDPPVIAGLIDFEDDPLEIMSLPEAQVHDWLIYLQSTLWDLHAPREQVDAVLDRLMATERAEVRALFALACKRLGWLRILPESRIFGRDTIAVQAVAAAAHRWAGRHRQDAVAV
jgi:tRNA A-37 threonylcarbamoyl transferase component Bud32